MMSRDDRWQQRLQNLNRAYDCLERACETPPEDERQQAGILHFFQMTFELCWKTLKDKLAEEEKKITNALKIKYLYMRR